MNKQNLLLAIFVIAASASLQCMQEKEFKYDEITAKGEEDIFELLKQNADQEPVVQQQFLTTDQKFDKVLKNLSIGVVADEQDDRNLRKKFERETAKLERKAAKLEKAVNDKKKKTNKSLSSFKLNTISE